MKDIAERLRAIEREMAKEKGPFLLFARFLREDFPDVWDLVVSAPWIESNKKAALSYITSKVRKALSPNEMTKISRTALIDRRSKALGTLRAVAQVEHGLVDLRNNEFFGMPIKHAYIVTSQKEAA